MHDYAIFVQARLGSTRLPRKVLRELRGKRVLDHVLESCLDTGIRTYLLVPRHEAEFFKDSFWYADVFGGSETDVLERFYECAIQNDVNNIVRITSDCVCLPSEHIAAVVAEHRNNRDKFVTNVSYDKNTYVSSTNIPDGFDVEVFNLEMLKNAHSTASKQQDREHVTSWMRQNYEIHVPNFALAVEGKFSIDTEEDIRNIERNFDIFRTLRTVRVEKE